MPPQCARELEGGARHDRSARVAGTREALEERAPFRARGMRQGRGTRREPEIADDDHGSLGRRQAIIRPVESTAAAPIRQAAKGVHGYAGCADGPSEPPSELRSVESVRLHRLALVD